MPVNNDQSLEKAVISSPKVSFPPFKTIITFIVLGLLLYALLSGLTYQFYASFLFLFYSLIKKMWLSVIGLGIFQTLLMTPVRMVNLKMAGHIKEFEEKIETIQSRKKQHQLFKKGLGRGESSLLWYLINFFLQTITYFSLGRLFLTDFYSQKLNPKLLYSFIPYPKYPIQGVFFKLPYPVITQTIDLGMDKVLIFWAVLIILKVIIGRLRRVYRRKRQQFEITEEEKFPFNIIVQAAKLASSSTVFLFFFGWLVIRNVPIGWQVKIFSGDISRPNPTLNLITAIMTFFIVVWLDSSKIRHKVKLARQENLDKKLIHQTQIQLFKNTFKKAFFLGAGAYFITNLIPSAFELSIFTLELISLLSPFTLDKLILRVNKKPNK